MNVVRVAVLDESPELAPGTAVRIKQPRLPELTWVVTDLEVGRSWTWVAKSPGVITTATHVIDAIDDGTCRVRQEIEHRGALSALVGLLTRARHAGTSSRKPPG